MKKKTMKDRFRRGIAIALAVVFGFSGIGTSNVLADDETYDVNPPVIEAVEFIPSADQLTTNDSVTLRVTAYDDGTGIKNAGANVRYADESGNFVSDNQFVNLTNTGENIYEGTISLLNYRNGGTLCLTYLNVYDANGNMTNGEEFIYNDSNNIGSALENYKTKISFSQGNISSSEIKTTSLGIYKDYSGTESIEGQTLEVNNSSVYFYLKMTVSDDTNVDKFYARFDGDNGTVINDVEFQKVIQEYNGSGYISAYKLSGKDTETFRLTHIYAKMTDGSVGEVCPDGFAFSDKWFSVYNDKSNTTPNESPDYESISFKVNGEEISPDQMIYPGNVIDVTVTIKPDKAYEDKIKAWFGTVLKDNNSDKYIELSRTDSDSNIYTGKFEVTEDLYPTVWQLYGMRWNSQSTTYGGLKGYYFTIQHGEGGTVVIPTIDINIGVMYYKNDSFEEESYRVDLKNVSIFSKITSEQLNLESIPSSVGEMNILSWHVYNNTGKDCGTLEEYKVMPNDTSLSVKPVYDKKIVTVTYSSIRDGEVYYEDVDYTYAQDEVITDDMVNSYLTKEGQSEAGAAFEKWVVNEDANSINEQLNTTYWDKRAYVSASACYVGKEVVVAEYDRGTLLSDYYEDIYLVDKGLTDEQLKEQVKAPKKNPYEGIDLNNAVKVKSWDLSEFNRGNWNGTCWSGISYLPSFENCVAQFQIDADDIDVDNFSNYYMGFNEGDVFTLSDEMGNYKNITWIEMGSDKGDEAIDGSESFTATKLMYFYGIGTYVKPASDDTTDNKPSDGTTDNKPSDGTSSGNTTTDTTAPSGSTGTTSTEYVPVKMTTEKIANEVNAITNAVKAGIKTITIAMDGATVVPTAILEAAKGKDINVVLDMGGYSWTINGKDIKSTNLKDVDLKVNFDTNAILGDLVSTLAGSNPTKQISLAYNGDFGFKANLSFNIGSEYQGKYGNLYYYDSNGKLVFMNAGKISSDGTVSLEFSHASDYVVVISEKSMASAAPTTGDNTVIIGWFLLIFAGAMLMLAASRRNMVK